MLHYASLHTIKSGRYKLSLKIAFCLRATDFIRGGIFTTSETELRWGKCTIYIMKLSVLWLFCPNELSHLIHQVTAFYPAAFWFKNLLAKAAARSFRTIEKYTDSDIFVGFRMISDDCRVKLNGTSFQTCTVFWWCSSWYIYSLIHTDMQNWYFS